MGESSQDGHYQVPLPWLRRTTRGMNGISSLHLCGTSLVGRLCICVIVSTYSGPPPPFASQPCPLGVPASRPGGSRRSDGGP